MSPAGLKLRRFPDAAAVASAVADQVESAAARALHMRGEFVLVLAGGTTPRAVYEILARRSTRRPGWRFLFGDERCVARGDSSRNDAMARDAWFSRIDVDSDQILPIPAELGPEAGAARYAETLQSFGAFDLVLLGIGEDGHTASLFPGHEWGTGADAPAALPVFDSPKPPPTRVSLSANRLGLAQRVLVLATGSGKAEPLEALLRGDQTPLAALSPQAGLELFCDEHAARNIKS